MTAPQQSYAYVYHFRHQSHRGLFAFGSDYGSDSMTVREIIRVNKGFKIEM